jgi:hypothetical protein
VREADKLRTIRLRVTIGWALDDRGITSPPYRRRPYGRVFAAGSHR